MFRWRWSTGELTSQLESMERTLNRQGLKLDRYLEYVGKSIDQWVAEERPDAESRLKVDLVLGEYAKQQGLEPSDEDVMKFLEEQAGEDDELKGQVDELKKSQSARRYFASRLRRRRVSRSPDRGCPSGQQERRINPRRSRTGRVRR